MKSDNTIINAAVVDLFCGAGGMTHGFIKEGLPVIAGIDVDPACRYPFEHNNNGAKFIEADIQDLSGTTISRLFPKSYIKILAGCAPCQPFSSYTNTLKDSDKEKDTKWGLLNEFARLVEEIRPEIVTMENVIQLTKRQVFHDFVESLVKLGYHVTKYEVYCPEYGVPQNRKRLVLLASLFGKISLIKPTHSPESFKTVRKTIGCLPPIEAGSASKKDRLHKASRLSERNFERIRASKPGGTWRDWDSTLVAECHKRTTGKTYPGVYARMEWDKPSPTITTQCYGFGNGRFGHPEQDRGISLREAAMLQTFPRCYRFVPPRDPVIIKAIGRMIGNAVPVRLGKIVARSILRHLKAYETATGTIES